MDKWKLAALVQDICVQSEVVSYVSNGGEQFVATVYCHLAGGDDYDQKCATFIEKFSKETQTNWITLKRRGPDVCVRYLFRKIFACHRSTKNKTNQARQYFNRIRNLQCEATMDFKWKKVNSDTCKNDRFLKEGLNCVIQIDFKHSHPVNAAESMVYLRCDKATPERFNSYFDKGMSPAVAKDFHEICLGVMNEAEDLNNPQVNPTSRQVKHLHSVWRKERQRGENRESEIIKRRTKELEELGYHFRIHEETKAIAIVTPLMKRVVAGTDSIDVVLIDSSDEYPNSKNLFHKSKLFMTFLFSLSKIGALPIGCVLHPTQDFQIFTLLIEAIQCCSQKEFCPKVIMSYDCAIQRLALQSIFPTTWLLLTPSITLETIWRKLWRALLESDIEGVSRKLIIEAFHNVLYSHNIETASEMNEELISKFKFQSKTLRYFENLWFRRHEWCLPFQKQVIPEGTDTVESEISIRIFKAFLNQRCRGFNTPVLLELICGPLEHYHTKRLRDFANSNVEKKVMSHFSSFFRVLHDYDCKVVKIGSNEYTVQVGGGPSYQINPDVAVCCCITGQSGFYCKDLCALEQVLGPRPCPDLTEEDKSWFYELATGVKKIPEPDLTGNVVKTEPPDYDSNFEARQDVEFGSSESDHPDNQVYLQAFEFCSTDIEIKDPFVKEEPCDEDLFPEIMAVDTFSVRPTPKTEEQSLSEGDEPVVNSIKREFNRIADILALNLSQTELGQYLRILQNIKTPRQATQLPF